MPRTIKQTDIQTRLAIRAEKDSNPSMSYKELQEKFGVNYSSVILAMKRTQDEWNVLLNTPSAKKFTPRPRDDAPLRQSASQPAIQPVQLLQAVPRLSTWEYKSIVVKGKNDLGTISYEFQDKGSVAWQSLTAKNFDDVLAMFGRESWELAALSTLNHGNTSFTGMYEIVFKRPKIA